MAVQIADHPSAAVIEDHHRQRIRLAHRPVHPDRDTAAGAVLDRAVLDARELGRRRQRRDPLRERGTNLLVADLGDREPDQLGPTLAPARAKDFAGLPPAYIATAEYDPLRDDGARYAELLRAAGVPVELHNAETLMHGYVSFGLAVPAAASAFATSLDALKAAL